MRGGKREGSGRKKGEETKVMRIPTNLVDEVNKLIAAHKDKQSQDNKPYEKCNKNLYPLLSKEQLIILQTVMIDIGYAKSKTQARKLTNTPKNCKPAFLEIVHQLSDRQFERLSDIAELYKV
ncbi:MAG: hypothetical protein P1P78_07680 [Methyloprofundus sp.]|nr:hypothetical protein [Methyloprofundus sp.]